VSLGSKEIIATMGNILTISGPRGVGKTTIIKSLSEEYQIRPIAPYTTRAMRRGEVNGLDYRFTDHTTFQRIQSEQSMLSALTLGDHSYGTPDGDFENALSDDTDAIRSVNLTPGGALQLRKRFGTDAIRSVMILPETWNDIERQMLTAGISMREVHDRMDSDPTELSLLPRLDRLVINAYGRMSITVKQIADYAIREFRV
jgi:guanylate kinase